MSCKRALSNFVLGRIAVWTATSRKSAAPPKAVFVLRNNDLGDVLTSTPLFEALKRLWPGTRVIAGVGDWARPLLANNPHVDEVLSVNAPWHNHPRAHYPPNSLRGLAAAVRYIYFSPEVRSVRRRRADIGVDVLGSLPGSLLLLRAAIPRRVGVRGYAGGESGCTDTVVYSDDEYVGCSPLRQVGLLGLADDRLPSVRPQVFLTPSELARAEAVWNGAPPSRRILVGLGGGYPQKCWPSAHLRLVVEQFAREGSWAIRLVGGPADHAAGFTLAEGLPSVVNLAGTVSLRDTLALAATAGRVLCNSSFVMHAAAAFARPTVVLLGPAYASAQSHARQWSCNPHARILGPEPHSPDVTSPDIAASALRDLPVVAPAGASA
jgi:heptosyltransferase-2